MQAQKLVHDHTGVTLKHGVSIRANVDMHFNGRIMTVKIVGIRPETGEIAVNATGDMRDNFWMLAKWADCVFEPCKNVSEYFYESHLRA